ncbi:uncharacterized protein LOC123522864 [Mercenaria mercenaria]|uniref:uncharacterized protein LOC123522864 n=1 Tax=Mercenaria mercenaria TaxID=6596 RepID=UPI00234E4356|nr:uncharacterized protein LOC123522864 [Mercenaria mercenaria]
MSDSHSSQEDDISIRTEGRFSNSESESDPVSDNENCDTSKLSSATQKCLFDIFGEDVVLKKQDEKSGISIDTSQKEVLNSNYRTESSNSLTAFNEDNFEQFPVDSDTDKYLEVPSLDSLVDSCLVKRHGSKASFSKNKQKALFSQPCKMIEKIAYKGQQASRLGIVMQLYIQQSLGSLVENISKDKCGKEQTIEHVQNIFAMTTKCLDQIGRSGAFHHVVRRTTAMCDTALYELEDASQFSNLPLSGEGVFGKGLEELLKSRKEKKKQLEDLVPEVKKRKLPDNSQPQAHKHARYDSTRPTRSSGGGFSTNFRSYNRDRWNNFRIPKLPNREGDSKKGYGQRRSSQTYKGSSTKAEKPTRQ